MERLRRRLACSRTRREMAVRSARCCAVDLLLTIRRDYIDNRSWSETIGIYTGT